MITNSNEKRAVSKNVVVVAVVLVLIVGASTAIALSYYYQPGTGTLTASSRSESASSSSSSLTSTLTASSRSESASSSSSSNPPLTPVTFMQPFPSTAPYTWLYYAIGSGIFEKHGLKVTTQIGTPVGVITAIGSGKVDFGYMDPSTVLLGVVNSNVTNVRSVAMLWPVNQYTIVYSTATIHNVSDLEGKRYGAFPGSATGQLLPVFARLNGLNYSSFRTTTTTSALVNSLLATGKVDFITQNINAVADIEPIARENSISIGAFPFAKYGLDIYGFSILTSTETIKSNPDLVQRFVDASMESLVKSIHDPEAAVASFVKLNPQLNYTITLRGWKMDIQLGLPNANSTTYTRDPLTIGWMTQSRMEETVKIVSQAYGIKNPPAASSLYTNQFVHAP